ncbi:RNA polymerase sigma factor [Posidoniimonas polymericola]|uniref:RNA polymerase sigma factor n=1 Tax=Posidoniimonas polymericola TaxID=2528002 RepID=A0A5C5YL55_9BACT|nr:sigma-70 family RNA polymerase sigma factor [Posidoniimonas polymericola]TWT75574.1 RNA polymerase sigma factor [Posidoniimonas polymericola]
MPRTVLTGSTLEPEAFVLLIARHERRIRGFIATLLPFDRDAVDDLIQTTYLVAWRKLAEFRYERETPDEEAVRWIIAIARFETFSHMRANKKHRYAELDEQLLGQIADVQSEDWGRFDARWRAFGSCVQKLEGSQREVIRLRYGLGLSLDEIGQRYGKLPNTIAARLSRIRRALEKCIGTSLQNEGYCR